MVEGMLVLPAAVIRANGIHDRNWAGLKTKSGSSSGPDGAQFAGSLLKSDTLQQGPSALGGMDAKRAKRARRGEKKRPLSNVVSRHQPLLENISRLITGNGSQKPMPVLSEDQIADIAQYFYLSWLDQRYTAWRTKCATSDEAQKEWLSKRYPQGELAGAELEAIGDAYTALVKEKLEAYNSHYMGALLTFKGKFMGQGEAQRDFMLKAYVKVLESSKELIRLHEGFDKKIADLAGQKKMRLEELERQKKECGPMVDKLFEERKELISGWISGKITPLDDFVKALKKVWGIAKVCLPIVGTLMMSSLFLSQLKDIAMRIPLVSQITPEIAGAGMVGLWLLVKVGKVVLDWHLKIAKSKLAKKAEMRKQEEMAKIAKAVAAANEDHQEALDKLRSDFEQDKEAVFGCLKAQYRKLLQENGYSTPPPPVPQSPFFDGMGVN